MSKPHPATTETSVMTSLKELSRIESGRLRAEAQEQAVQRERKQAAEVLAQAEREAREQAAVAARQEAEEAKAREERIEAARRAGRKQAAREVARIQAESQAQLERDNAVRAHQLQELQVRRTTGRRRREFLLVAALALVTCVGGASTYRAHRTAGAHQQTAEELSGRNAALLQEREESKRIQFRTLDRRHGTLVSRFTEKSLEAERKTALAARDAVNEAAPTHSQLRTFASALDGLETRGLALGKLRQLDARYADLAAWAGSVRRSKATKDAARAAARAKAPGATEDDRRAYALALNRLRQKLTTQRRGSSAGPVAEIPIVEGTCQVGDPGCGLDGKPLF